MKGWYEIGRYTAAWSVLVFIVGMTGAAAQTTAHQDEQELRRDLRSVIILAGYPCHTVESITQPRPTDYHVSCDADRLYRVQVSEEKGVVVESRSDPEVAAPAPRDHEAFMRRQLFAIVNLAGHRCDEVSSYVRRGSRDGIVTCGDGSTYRIHVTPEGRVAVDEHPVDK